MNKLKLLLLVIAGCYLNSARTMAQCSPVVDPCTDTITIDAPDTLKVCNGEFSFNTVIHWNGLNSHTYWWDATVPHTADVTSTETTLTNTLTLGSTATYCLTARGMGPDLILNGSFTNATPPLCFAQDAPYFLAGDVLDGNKTQILPSIYQLGPGTLSARSGPNMLVVNGGRWTGNEAFWKQTVNICPGATYRFNAFYANYNGPSGGTDFTQLQVRVNGVIMPGGPFSTTTNNTWTLIQFDWTAGPGVTTAVIELIDINTVEWLNDFGVDDISFRRIDLETKCITLVPVAPPIFTISGPLCVCSGNSFTLSSNVTGGTYGGVTYDWDYGAATTPAYEHPGVNIPCRQERTMKIPLTVVNGAGCKKTLYHNVDLYPRPKINSISGPTGPICGSDKITVKADKCGKGVWSVISGWGGIATVLPSGSDDEFNFIAANVCCATTIVLRCTVTSPCADCPADFMDYSITVKPKPHAGITILSCNPLCPGNDVELRVCGTPGAKVHFSYTYPGCSAVDQTLVLPAGPCCTSVCTTLVVPRIPCPMAEGDFVATLFSAELDHCVEYYHSEEKIKIAYPSATITLLGPPPCQGNTYCIRITGTPGARVNLFPEYMAYDPSYPAYVDLPFSTTGALTTSVDICGLVIPPPPPVPGGTSYGMNTFCIQSIIAPAVCGGCMVESDEIYIDPLHHPLPCLNVMSRELPQFGVDYEHPVCPPDPFTLVVDVYTPGATPAVIAWVPGFGMPGFDFSPITGTNYETVTPGATGIYTVYILGTNGCISTRTLTVLPTGSVAPPSISLSGSVCEGALGAVGVTFTGVPGTVITFDITPGGSSYVTLDWTGTVTVPMTVAPLTVITITDVYKTGYCKGTGPFGSVTVPKIPAPTATLSCTGSTCSSGVPIGVGTSVTLTGSAGAVVTYTSSPLTPGMPASGTVPITTAVTPVPGVPTTYSVTSIFNPITGCYGITSPAPCTIGEIARPDCPPTYTYSALTHDIVFTAPVGGVIHCTFVDVLGTILNPTPIPVAVGTVYTIPATTSYIFINPIEINGCAFYYDCALFPLESSGGGGGSTTGPPLRGTNQGQNTPGITEITKDAGSLAVIPNPNTGSFTLSGYMPQLATAHNVTVEISDMLGKVLYSEQSAVTNGKIDKQVTMTNVANGVYLIKVHGEGVNQTLRFTLRN